MKRRSGLIALMLVVLMLLQSVAYATEADLNAGTPLADYTLGDYIEDQEAAALAASAEESAEPTYLEQIAALQAQAEALDPESETLEDELYTIYEAVYAVVDAATLEWEEGTMTDEEYEEVMVAAQGVWDYLKTEYGFDPYATENLPLDSGFDNPTATYTFDKGTAASESIVSGRQIQNFSFSVYDANGNTLSSSGISYTSSTTGSGGDQQTAYTLTVSESAAVGTYYVKVRYSQRQGDNSTTLYYVVNIKMPDVYEEEVVVSKGSDATQTVTGTYDGEGITITDAQGNAITDKITVSISGTTATVGAAESAAVGTYTATWTDTDGSEHFMPIVVAAENDEGSVTIEQGGSARPTVSALPASEVTIIDAEGNEIESGLITVTGNYGGTLTVTASYDVEVGKYIALYTDSTGEEHSLTINVTEVTVDTPDPDSSDIIASDISVSVYQGESTTQTIADADDYVYFVFNSSDTLVENVTVVPSDTNDDLVTVSASSSASTGTYTVVYVKKDGSASYSMTVTVSARSGNNNSGQNYVLSQNYYSGSTKVYYDEMTSTTTTSSNGETTTTYSASSSDHIESVTLNQITVVEGNSSLSSGWSGGSALSTYYGSSLDSADSPITKSLTITPSEGYYVTKIVVACCGGGSPYNCGTWKGDVAFTADFSVDASGSVTIDLPSNSFGHTSNSGNYFILIMTAKIPTPLYVEYNYGAISEFLTADEISKSVFATPSGWTDTTAGNIYYPANSTAADDGGIMTPNTQYKYTYNNADGSTEDATSWVHKSNTVLTAAKTLAASKGYYFVGWNAVYYNEVDPSDGPDAYGNNYKWDFSDSYGSITYGEAVNVELTTNVKLTAIWAPIELRVTKTVTGLSSYTGTLPTYKFQVYKWNDGTSAWDAYGSELSLTPTSSADATYAVNTFSPVTAGKYKVVETSDGGNLKSTDGETMFYVSYAEDGSVEYTTAGILDGTTRSFTLNVVNSYSNEPALTDLIITKTVKGNMGDQSKEFEFSVVIDAPDGTTKTEPVKVAHGQSVTIKEVPVGSQITVTETTDGYTASFTSEGTTATVGTSSAVAVINKLGTYGATIHYTNEKNGNVDTGVTLDSMPYMLLLAAGAGLMMLAARRRRTDN